ncbi:hypothetical protein NIASO_06210 [Niabella soli DSM 19437]|uniref:Uncharacterized protein n=1 Tax=Niabella soli DSM 19437 TaxID=929713 RepID=W0F2V2_9BACT|nr:hypothetical protein NIASO_06210 [Niabella soli DSM 19437]
MNPVIKILLFVTGIPGLYFSLFVLYILKETLSTDGKLPENEFLSELYRLSIINVLWALPLICLVSFFLRKYPYGRLIFIGSTAAFALLVMVFFILLHKGELE